ncbi:MAG: DUF3107 domain-containing protein [Actinomycetales bacterium]|nr:DUF3107 domain-containing protein [Actinomycetales bacterium]
MDVKIGIKQSPRELTFDSAQGASEIYSTVENAIASASKLIKFNDSKGRVFVIPTDSLAYVEIGAEESRRVGFIS